MSITNRLQNAALTREVTSFLVFCVVGWPVPIQKMTLAALRDET
jgi:hypothetical protein